MYPVYLSESSDTRYFLRTLPRSPQLRTTHTSYFFWCILARFTAAAGRGGAGRSAKGDTGTTGTAVGTWMGKGGGEGQTGGKEEKEGWEGLRLQTSKPNKTKHKTLQ